MKTLFVILAVSLHLFLDKCDKSRNSISLQHVPVASLQQNGADKEHRLGHIQRYGYNSTTDYETISINSISFKLQKMRYDSISPSGTRHWIDALYDSTNTKINSDPENSLTIIDNIRSYKNKNHNNTFKYVLEGHIILPINYLSLRIFDSIYRQKKELHDTLLNKNGNISNDTFLVMPKDSVHKRNTILSKYNVVKIRINDKNSPHEDLYYHIKDTVRNFYINRFPGGTNDAGPDRLFIITRINDDSGATRTIVHSIVNSKNYYAN